MSEKIVSKRLEIRVTRDSDFEKRLEAIAYALIGDSREIRQWVRRSFEPIPESTGWKIEHSSSAGDALQMSGPLSLRVRGKLSHSDWPFELRYIKGSTNGQEVDAWVNMLTENEFHVDRRWYKPWEWKVLNFRIKTHAQGVYAELIAEQFAIYINNWELPSTTITVCTFSGQTERQVIDAGIPRDQYGIALEIFKKICRLHV